MTYSIVVKLWGVSEILQVTYWIHTISSNPPDMALTLKVKQSFSSNFLAYNTLFPHAIKQVFRCYGACRKEFLFDHSGYQQIFIMVTTYPTLEAQFEQSTVV